MAIGPADKNNFVQACEQTFSEKLKFETEDGYDQRMTFTLKRPEMTLGQKVSKVLLQPLLFLVGIIMTIIVLIIVAIGGLCHKLGHKAFIIDHLVLVKKFCSKEVQDLARKHIKTVSETGGVGKNYTVLDDKTKNRLEVGQITKRSVKAKDREWAIYITGVASNMQFSINQMGRIYDNLDMNVICINHPGLGRSEGHAASKDDLLIGAKKAIKILKEKGVSVDKMHLWGHSLGGGIAAELAAKDEYKGINLVLDRSFDRFENAVGKFSYSPRPLNWVLSAIVKSILPFNTEENFKKVRGKKTIICAPDDAIVHHSSSAEKLDPSNHHTMYVHFGLDAEHMKNADLTTKIAPNHTLYRTPKFLKCVKVFHKTQKTLVTKLREWARSAKAAVESQKNATA